MFDVTIIGGGPAGAAAATLLSGRGRAVAIVEQHRFPRDKVCGECLSSLGVDVLGRLGALPALRKIRPATLVRTVIHAPGGGVAMLDLPRPMWGLSRMRMDAALLDVAKSAGADVLQPARCEGVAGGGRPVVRVRDPADNSVNEIESRVVLLADGKGALIPSRPNSTRDFGLKAHFRRVDGPRDQIELFGVRGHYGGLAPIEDDLWNVAFSVPAARLAEAHGDLDGMFGRIVAENRGLTEWMRSATRCGPWLASPLPRFAVRRQWPENVIPLGNAAAALEPIGGEGMGLALRSAELAAEAVHVSLSRRTPVDVAALGNDFDRLWRLRRAMCRAIALAVSRPGIANAAVPAAAAATAVSGFLLGMLKEDPYVVGGGR